MGQALYRKWRPQTFDDIVGQQHIVQTLRYALRTGHIHHAYLLAGPRGTGKTTTARLIAKAVNCLAPEDERPCNVCEICTAISEGRLMDLVEIDAASNTGVDNIRDLLEKVNFRPTQAAYKVYVIDEVHMLSTQAFNALLKTLEEPPAHVIFVLATTEVHKIPETILSRCQRFEFRRIPVDALIERLDVIASAEGVEAEPEALELIARAATGSMRDAISLFDQMAAGGNVTADYVRLMLGAERREVVRELIQAWVDQDLTQGLSVINRAVDGGADPRQLARQLADTLRGLLLMRLGAGHTWTDPTADERSLFEEMARKADADALVDAVRRFSEVASNQRTGWQPQLPLELAFVEAALATSTAGQSGAPSPASSRREQTGAAEAASGESNRSRRSAPQKPSAQPTVERAAEKRSVTSSAGKASTSQETGSSGETPVAESDEAQSQTEDSPAEDLSGGSTPEVSSGLDAAFIGKVKTHWADIIRQIQPVTLAALLRDAEVGGADHNGHLVLRFQHAFHCEKVAEQSNLRKLEDAFERLLKQHVRLRCVLAEDWQPSAAPAPQATPEETHEEDELIRRAQQELGAVARFND